MAAKPTFVFLLPVCRRGTPVKNGNQSWIELARGRAARHGLKTAYLFLENGEEPAEEISFTEMDARARALAGRLQSRCSPGDRVLLLYPSGIEYMVAFFACLYAGLVAVPVFAPRSSKHNARLEGVLRDCGASLALTTGKELAEMSAFFEANPGLRGLPWLASDAVEKGEAEAWRPPPVGADTTAFLQYTSGSTGVPKGVIVTHGNLLYNQAMIRQGFASTPESTCVSWLPIYHDMGLIGNMLHAFYGGATCVFMSPVSFLQRPVRWLRAISQYKARVSGGPNFSYELCLQRIPPEALSDLDLSTWNIAFNGAEPVRHATLERFAERFAACGFRKRSFYPCYGMAETTLIVSGRKPEAESVHLWVDRNELGQDRVVEATAGGHSLPLVGCGKALLAEWITIVDPVTLTCCPPGRVGEIWVAGPHVAQGYWNRPEETVATFEARTADDGNGPFLRTGDLGFLKDGEVYVTGRLKDVIVVRGVNHYPQDVEAAAEAASPAIRKGGVAAFSVEAGSDERVVVVAEVERTLMRKFDPALLTGLIRRQVLEVEELMVAEVAFIRPGTLPKTSSGKVQRRRCREQYLTGALELCQGGEAGEAEPFARRA
jgi:acyl-CoA synthetase (AMP-forming)/AMP-acid ligase II